MADHTTRLYIAQDRRLEDGSMLRSERISRPLERVTIAKRVLKRLRRRNPAAYPLWVTTL